MDLSLQQVHWLRQLAVKPFRVKGLRLVMRRGLRIFESSGVISVKKL